MVSAADDLDFASFFPFAEETATLDSDLPNIIDDEMFFCSSLLILFLQASLKRLHSMADL